MKLHKFGWLWVVLVIVVALWSSCTRATMVGNDLLSEEVTKVGFTDTFKLRARTVTEDSIITHSSTSGSQIIGHTFGKLDDPHFGRSSSEIVTQMFLSEFGSEFLEFDIDSVIMSFVYDSLGSYGNLNEPISVEITRNGTNMDITENYFSNDVFTKNLVPMGRRLNFIPNFEDSTRIDRPGDTTFLRPHMRITMSDNFIRDLQRQSKGTYEIDDSFAMWFKGLHVIMTQGENTMVGINLNHDDTGMTVYYSAPDSTLFKSYQFIFNGRFNAHVRVATFENDYTGSVAENFIDNWDTDSLMFVQSLSGLNSELTFEGLDSLEDVLINQAILEVYVAELADDDRELYGPVNRIQTRTVNSDGRLVNSRDVNFAIGLQEISFFGGNLSRDDDGNLLYRMNVTASIQDIVQNRAENQIFISSFLKQNNARRVILYGPGHPDFPARLNVRFTKTR